ncbi:MAG: YneF family protein [Erysipelotrichaceae bacterium]|nr:YneF family protein [Erysipelotrichaceae bacterium]
MSITAQTVMYLIAGIIIGAIAGFFGARYYFQKQMKENPPITEKMIRAMFLQMGRKPSEAQIRSIMKSMGQETAKK